MSSGQRPRWNQFFPKMKRRGKGRTKPARIVLYDGYFGPVWPPVIGGMDLRRPTNIVFTNQFGSRVFTGRYWEAL